MSLLLIFLLTAMQAGAQHIAVQQPYTDPATAYGPDYIKPQFYGGDSMLHKYFLAHEKYPDTARENNIMGRVVVRFLVDEKGHISHTALLRGIGGGCDEEALRLIKEMPAWQPATYKNVPVPSVQILFVTFNLE